MTNKTFGYVRVSTKEQNENRQIEALTFRKSLIRIFVNRIYLFDDKITVTFNSGDEEVQSVISC